MKRLALLLATMPLLCSCVTAAVSAGTEVGIAMADERSFGRNLDDNTIYADINRMLLQSNDNDIMSGITVDVRHARVLLTGNVSSEAQVQRVVEMAWKAGGVEEVLNEITVNPGADFTNAAEDSLVKKNLEGRLLITKDVWVINYSISVVNGTAYLLGRVHDQAELDRVLNVARTTQGVKRVINYLQIRSESDPVQPAVSPYGNGATPPATSSQGYSTTPARPSAPAQPSITPRPAPTSSGQLGSDGYAAPELIQSHDIK